jgi:hypothetical protein
MVLMEIYLICCAGECPNIGCLGCHSLVLSKELRRVTPWIKSVYGYAQARMPICQSGEAKVADNGTTLTVNENIALRKVRGLMIIAHYHGSQTYRLHVPMDDIGGVHICQSVGDVAYLLRYCSQVVITKQ